MSIIKDKRIYMECKDSELYMNEIMEIINLGLDKHPIIWNQVSMEDDIVGNGFFDIYLSANKSDSEGKRIFDRRIWVELVTYGIKKAHFACMGCWENQQTLIEEIKSKYQILKIEKFTDQVEFYIDLEKCNKEHITDMCMDTNGNIKWFNFNLYNKISDRGILLSSSHFGEEYYINKLTEEEIEEIIRLVDNNDIYIRINKHNSSCLEDLE